MAEIQPPLFVAVNGQIGPDELGLPYRDLFSEGICEAGDLAVSAPGGMNVRVASGAAWIEGDDDPDAQPTYRVRNVGNVDLALAAANGANPRKDLVIAEVLDAAFSGASYSWRLRVVQGAPGAVPAEPALPNNAIKLAVVTVPAAAAAIVAGNIADSRARAQIGAGDVQLAVADPVIYDSGELVAVAAALDTGTLTLPAGTRYLRMILKARSDQATDQALGLQLNNDTSAIYATRYDGGGDSAAQAGGSAGSTSFVFPSVTLTGSTLSAERVSIVDLTLIDPLSVTRMKSLTGHVFIPRVGAWQLGYGGEYRSTSPINRVKFFPGVGNFGIGSRLIVEAV
jgi:hypothetical protein